MRAATVRDRLFDALLALTAERGLEGLSIREVAAAAGVSIGTVQYYCRNRDQMLQMAFEEANRRILERVHGIDKAGHVAAVLRRALLEFVPLDRQRRTEAAVYLAFSAQAAVSAPLAAVRQSLIEEQHALCADTYRLAQERGEAVRRFDPDLAARATVALVDGLLLNVLTDPAGWHEVAPAVLDQHLSRYVRVDDERSASVGRPSR